MKKDLINILSEKKLHYLIITIVVLIGAISHWGYVYPDSECYIRNSVYLTSLNESYRIENADCLEHRMNRPVTPFLAGVISPMFGTINSFSIINTFFWLLGSIFMYKLVLKFYGNKKLAFLSSIFYATSIPIIRYGAAVLTDVGGYFFTILAIYLLYDLNERIDIKKILFTSFIFFIGIITKEHLMFVVLIYIILSKMGNRKIALKSSLIIIFILLFVSSFYFSLNVDTFRTFNNAPEYGYTYDRAESWGINSFLLSFGGFLYLTPLAVLGFLLDNDKKRILNYYYILLSLLPLFIWPAMEYRITFIMSPLIIPLASLGTEKFSLLISQKPIFSKLSKRQYEIIILIMYVIISYSYVFLYHPPELNMIK